MLFLVNPWVLTIWVAASWLIAFMGKNKRYGFFGLFLISVLFSPVVGLIVLLASDDRPTRIRANRHS